MWAFWNRADPTAKGMAIVTLCSVIFTILSLLGSVHRYMVLRTLGLNGDRRFFCVRMLRHESIRLMEHCLLVYAAVISIFRVRFLFNQRDIIIVFVALLISLNALLDLIDRWVGFYKFVNGHHKE